MEVALAILSSTLAAMVAWVVHSTRSELRDARKDWHDRADKLHVQLVGIVRELAELRGRMERRG